MTTKTTAVVAGLLALSTALPAFALDIKMGADTAAVHATASTTAGGRISASLAARIEKGKSHAQDEISRRVTALNGLGDKVQAMARITADMKGSISATIQSQISALQALQTKIDADTDIDALKADIKSITESYRIFMLVLPQGRITAASDSIQIASATLTTLSGKLQVRIAEAQSKGKDVTALNVSLTDMNAKIADANTQAGAAVTVSASLKPDNGDKTIMDANKAAIKDAQTKLKAARADLVAARKDAGDIVKALKAMHTDMSATTTTSASTTMH